MHLRIFPQCLNIPLKRGILVNIIFKKTYHKSFVPIVASCSLKNVTCNFAQNFTTRNFNNTNKNMDDHNEKVFNANSDNCSSELNITNLKKVSELDLKGQRELNEFLRKTENEKFYKMLLLEIDIMRQNSEKVPSIIRPRYWAELIKLKSVSQRKKYLSFLWTIEKKKENAKAKKERQRLQRLKELEEQKHDTNTYSGLRYELSGNSLFMRFYSKTINQLYNRRLMNAMLFGNKIVMDCSYDIYMNQKELQSCARQILHAFATNRVHDMPFDIHFCNAEKNSILMQKLNSYIPNMYDIDFPINITHQSYLELFDRKKLLYLTPHCREEIQEYDPNTIYIIGAYVDKCRGQPLSLAKAKREGLKMGKLPLDKFLKWGSGSSKNLTLNQVIKIMLDVQKYRDWNIAMKNVPTRKLDDRFIKMKTILMSNTLDNSLNIEDTKDISSELFDSSSSHCLNVASHHSTNKTKDATNCNTDVDFSHDARIRFRGKWSK